MDSGRSPHLSTAKFELTKAIEARKLNPRTGMPTSDPSVTIPYGAVIENLTKDRDMDKFRYLLQPYQCAHDILSSAIVPVAAFSATTAAAPAVPVSLGTDVEPGSEPVASVRPVLVWEVLAGGEVRCQRAKVSGGWLVLAGNSALTYYPDAAHAWDGGSLA
jgi:hypothetical protein